MDAFADAKSRGEWETGPKKVMTALAVVAVALVETVMFPLVTKEVIRVPAEKLAWLTNWPTKIPVVEALLVITLEPLVVVVTVILVALGRVNLVAPEALAFADSTKVVALVILATVVPAGILFPAKSIPATIPAVVAPVTVVLALVVVPAVYI
jgi:hypothetical protein